MEPELREDRLRADLATLTTLRQASSIFDFRASGDPPDRYALTFRGKGIARDMSPRSDIQIVELHEVDMRLPFAYPSLPPDIRWVTPILHPNVSFSGFINLRDVGLPWDESVMLDAVCERLWDVVRMAYMNLERATNFSAKSWVDTPHQLALPLDARMLRDTLPPPGENVIRYQRRGAARPSRPSADRDVLFIGEDTPVPPLPGREFHPRPRGRGDDDDILYIGDD